MFGSAFWLTLATLLGLCLGFAREWLLVNVWGAGGQSDAFLVALFLPEALRMSLAGGLLSAAALPLYLERDHVGRSAWLGALLPQLLLLGVGLSLLIMLAAPALVQLIGPGLDTQASALASSNLRLLIWCAPGLLLHALLSVPLQANARFVLAGLGSLLFNFPPVLYMALMGQHSQPQQLAQACLLGSLLMPLALLPGLRSSVQTLHWNISSIELRQLGTRIGPLLASSGASQGLALLERLIASLLGEGAVTWVNLARKLVNLPLIALMSLNQVLLGLLSASPGNARLALLRRGLDIATLLSLPAGVGLISSATCIVGLLFPQQPPDSPLPLLLAGFSVPLVFGAWNALLARHAYAAGDTRKPLYCELLGSAINAILLAGLPFSFGLLGIPFAALGGVISTALLLMHRQGLLQVLPWRRYWIVSLVLLLLAAALQLQYLERWLQLGLSTVAGCITMLGLALWFKPWRPT